MMRRFIGLAFVTLLGGAGCEADRETQIEQVCTHVCACRSGLPTLQDLCLADCVDDAGNFDPPPGCIECLLAETCADLFSDTCEAACSTDLDAP